MSSFWTIGNDRTRRILAASDPRGSATKAGFRTTAQGEISNRLVARERTAWPIASGGVRTTGDRLFDLAFHLLYPGGRERGSRRLTERQGDSAVVSRTAMRKASWRILPLIMLAYLFAYIDRVNVSFAAQQMNSDLKFSATIYGLGGGLFFLGYALFEIPSNLMLLRFGARPWIARIMITWVYSPRAWFSCIRRSSSTLCGS
jgi:hypothetical protein